MANTYTQLHIQFVFAVQYRAALIQKNWRARLHKYITGIFQNNDHKMLQITSMPDHIHMIIVIKNRFNKNVLDDNYVGDEIKTRAGTRPAPTLELNKTLGTIIGELKSIITNEYIKNIKIINWPKFDKRLWQRNFYERIIRNEKEYLIYKKYIRDNPKKYLSIILNL